MPDDPAKPLSERILEALQSQPGQKAGDLARHLGVERRAVNRCLNHDLAGRVVQDAAYRWRASTGAGHEGLRQVQAAPQSELARLCRYYLDCIGQDDERGVSTFAASNFGDPDYAELSALPLVHPNRPWWTEPGVERIIHRVRADQSKLTAWVGYPVRLREHRTARWRGFFVDPVFLWQVALPERPGDPYLFVDDLPVPNFAFLRSVAAGDPGFVVDEAARLDEELGLNSPLEDRPEVDEIIDRLVSIRQDWDWREPIDPAQCPLEPKLSGLNQSGIYNRAIIIPAERSPYTAGLESELKSLGELPEATVGGTALGGWLSGDMPGPVKSTDQPLIEVLPMNTEQRTAVMAALSSRHTVVTGPPGTGKSQVVTNLLVNAAWRGMKVLFASKNNKAVDVVEARVNGLGSRPVLLRLGSKEYQAKLADYLTAMLSGNVTEEDRVSYAEGLERHKQLAAKSRDLERLQAETMNARNLVDRLESELDTARDLFSRERFNAVNASLLDEISAQAAPCMAAIDANDPTRMGVLGKVMLKLSRSRRCRHLRSATAGLATAARHLELPDLVVGEVADPEEARRWLDELMRRQTAARSILTYQHALEALRRCPSFEQLASDALDLNQQIASNSSRLWRDWVQLAPSRLTAAQRRDVADYTAVLQLITGPEAETVNAAVKQRARQLQPKVTALFSCWAVTSLSARSKVPFEPGGFDLIVIDEASQCDIASALPLLYRAKRTVIIGDPMQLKHISALTKAKDSDLQAKYGLVEGHNTWAYSVNSLYDLAAGMAQENQIVNLRDHHRSHADIIGFSNREFYGGRLRVATRYTSLRRRRSEDPGVIWQDVRGTVTRPGGSGARNVTEARAVCAALHDLLITRGYQGSVGVVTPFRSQAQCLQELIANSAELTAAGARADLLVDTVHKFQGDERDVMIFSPVVSDGISAGSLGFLRSNGNLFNVAITRARGLLHVVGDRSAASTSGVDWLERFSEYVAGLQSARPNPAGTEAEDLGPDYPAVSNPERVSDWEKVLYRALHAAGIRAIPQYSVEQYDLDFALIAGGRRLNVEVDGERYHRSWTGELCIRDQLRNQRLIELGWEVKRFWVYEVRDRLDDVVRSVADWVAERKPARTPKF